MPIFDWFAEKLGYTRAPARKRPTVTAGGVRDLSTLLTHGPTVGNFSAAWTDSRIEQVRHYKHWIYIGIKRIGDMIASQIPNVSKVLSDRDPDVRRSLNINYRHAGSNQYHKALTPLQYHEYLEPVRNDHPLVRLIKDPNEPDTAFDLWYETILFLYLTGSAYWWIPRNLAGLPAAIWVIPSHWVWPILGLSRLIDGYEIRPIEGNYLRRFIPADEMIHVRFKSPISKIDGNAPLTSGNQWGDTQESIDRARWWSFRNGAFPGCAIEFDSRYDDPSDVDLERIEKKFLARYVGETRFSKPVLLPPGTSLKKLNITPAEMAYVESADQIRDHLLALLGVPAVVAGINKEMTYGAVLAAQAGFCYFTIKPLLRMLSDALTEHLARLYDPNLRIWWEDPTPEDPQIREEQFTTDLAAGAITPNELRALRGRRPYRQGGDDPILNGANAIYPLNSGGTPVMASPGTSEPSSPQDSPSATAAATRRIRRALSIRRQAD